MVLSKYNKDDMIMGYQTWVTYTGLFAGKVLEVHPVIKLFGTSSYRIELTKELQRNGITRIWVKEESSFPFNRETYEKALSHWNNFYEYMDRANKEIKSLRGLFPKS